MSMRAAGWNLGRGGRSLWWGALLALIALLGLGIWTSTRGSNDAENAVVAQPAPVRVALVFAKPVASPTSPFGGGPEAIYLASPTGNDPRRLARGADPVISPDGRSVVYRRDTKAVPSALLIISTGSGKPRQLPASSDEPVVWSPDSRLVAATGQRPGGHRRRWFTQRGHSQDAAGQLRLLVLARRHGARLRAQHRQRSERLHRVDRQRRDPPPHR